MCRVQPAVQQCSRKDCTDLTEAVQATFPAWQRHAVSWPYAGLANDLVMRSARAVLVLSLSMLVQRRMQRVI
jgi:hypothetical protein